MADQFSQAEIDELIQSGLGGVEPDADAEPKNGAAENAWITPPKSKYIKSPKPPEFRFPKMYRSPLVKQEDMVIDPDPAHAAEIGDQKVVVRTLGNFVEFLQNKKQHPQTKSIDKR